MPVMRLSSFMLDPATLLAPSGRDLWRALTSGRVLLPAQGDGAWCTVSPEAPFAGLFDPNEAVQRQAQHRLNTVLWTYSHRWGEAAQQWAVDQVRNVPLEQLQRPARDVFEHSVAEEHADDGLLAYAWWGGVPAVFEALRQRGLSLDGCRWRGEPLPVWLQRAQDHPGSLHARWGGALLAQRERRALSPLFSTVTPRFARVRSRL